jgi:hypothetical protein
MGVNVSCSLGGTAKRSSAIEAEHGSTKSEVAGRAFWRGQLYHPNRSGLLYIFTDLLEPPLPELKSQLTFLRLAV